MVKQKHLTCISLPNGRSRSAKNHSESNCNSEDVYILKSTTSQQRTDSHFLSARAIGAVKAMLAILLKTNARTFQLSIPMKISVE